MKLWAEMALNVCGPFSGGHTKKRSARVGRQLFGQVWENLGKSPLHQQKFACFYIYASICAGVQENSINVDIFVIVIFFHFFFPMPHLITSKILIATNVVIYKSCDLKCELRFSWEA